MKAHCDFLPDLISLITIWRCNWKGEKPRVAGPLPSPSMVSRGVVHATPQDVIFRDPSFFVAGELTIDPVGSSSYRRPLKGMKFCLSSMGSRVLSSSFPLGVPFRENTMILRSLRQRFSPIVRAAKVFEEFISTTRVTNGSVLVWGSQLVRSIHPV